MTVHTIRQVTALQRASARWQKRQPRPQPARQVRTPNTQPASALSRFLRACNTIENSQLAWKGLTAAFVIGYIAYFISHWPHA